MKPKFLTPEIKTEFIRKEFNPDDSNISVIVDDTFKDLNYFTYDSSVIMEDKEKRETKHDEFNERVLSLLNTENMKVLGIGKNEIQEILEYTQNNEEMLKLMNAIKNNRKKQESEKNFEKKDQANQGKSRQRPSNRIYEW